MVNEVCGLLMFYFWFFEGGFTKNENGLVTPNRTIQVLMFLWVIFRFMYRKYVVNKICGVLLFNFWFFEWVYRG